MRVYLIPQQDFGYDELEMDQSLAFQLEDVLKDMFRQFGIDGAAEWYYDEFVEPIEYGVKVDIRGVSQERFHELVHDIVEGCLQHFAAVGVEFP